ncbi:ATP-binding protein [Knoellia sp. S7-12]|uniref:sensor histidine kinase n=1 Tax=Knoellia sp. S7-12 TaxID=3126698 RepID=UPI0033680082
MTDTRSDAAASDSHLPVPESAAPVAWVTVSQPRHEVAVERPLRPRRVLLQLLAALVVVFAVVGVLGTLAARRLAEREAVNDAAKTADVLADAVITPALTDLLVDGDTGAIADFDALIHDHVLGPSIVRVKLWSPTGDVVYADEPQLIGRTFSLSEDQLASLAQPQTIAEVSDLDSSENEFETGGRLLEVYRPVWAPDGRQLLFETYSPYVSVEARTSQLWRGFAGVTLSSLLLLIVLMAPVLWRLLRRLAESQRQRERLLERTVEASDTERRRIAGTLHDGPVQDLVASSFAAAGAAARARTSGDEQAAAGLDTVARSVRHNIRILRSLLVDIYPPTLSGSGLVAALGDLASSATSRGLVVRLRSDPDSELRLTDSEERLVYRIAQECLYNAAKHAVGSTVDVSLARVDDAVVLEVADDGPGFDTGILQNPLPDHFGLRVLRDLATDADASLEVASAPGAGTHWRLTLALEESP